MPKFKLRLRLTVNKCKSYFLSKRGNSSKKNQEATLLHRRKNLFEAVVLCC